ncbi:MAG: hypothetical protein MHPSP_001925, partial [Paramarteilia canceri]
KNNIKNAHLSPKLPDFLSLAHKLKIHYGIDYFKNLDCEKIIKLVPKESGQIFQLSPSIFVHFFEVGENSSSEEKRRRNNKFKTLQIRKNKLGIIKTIEWQHQKTDNKKIHQISELLKILDTNSAVFIECEKDSSLHKSLANVLCVWLMLTLFLSSCETAALWRMIFQCDLFEDVLDLLYK